MRMTRFLEPADVKGTVSLLIEHAEKDDDIWIYLPSVKKVRRLVSSNKKDSFVGTDFSYGDVIGHKVKEWDHNFVTLKAVLYDESGELLKEAKFTNYSEVDPTRHKWQAGQLETRNVQAEHSTVIHIDQIKVNVGVKDDYFTTRYMEQQ